MFKKFVSLTLLMTLLVFLPSCGQEKSLKAKNKDITDKKAEITVYLPQGQEIDNKYYRDKQVAINYLPADKKAFTEKEVDDIVNNIDKHVKVLIIRSEKTGLEDVFKKVKDKLPGVITVAADMGELHNDKLYSMLKNPNLDVAFTVESNKRALESAEIAKIMGAERYIYVSKTSSQNLESKEDMQAAKEYCSEHGMKFASISLGENSNLTELLSKVREISGKEIKKTALFPAEESLSRIALQGALKEGYMLADINSKNDGKLLSQELNLEEEYKTLSRAKFDEKVAEKLKEYNLQGKLAGISEGLYSIPSELAIEIAKFMYEKNYMIEECYRDVSVIARGNRNLKLSILPKDIALSLAYTRNLIVSPRIY